MDQVRIRRWLRILVIGVIGIVSLGWVSTYYIDYGYMVFLASRQLEGRPVESCLDLPAKYWTRIPKCLKLYFPDAFEEAKPTSTPKQQSLPEKDQQERRPAGASGPV